MLFEKQQPLEILTCPTCRSTGSVRLGKKCPECGGMAMGRSARGWWLYWDYPLTRYNITLQKIRPLFNNIRRLTIAAIGINFWIWFGLGVYRGKSWLFVKRLDIPGLYESLNGRGLLLFSLGLLSFVYLWYRVMRERPVKGAVERYDYKKAEEKEGIKIVSWAEVCNKFSRRKRHNISDTFTIEALKSIGDAYRLGDKLAFSNITPEHLFYALLDDKNIASIFTRLGFSAKQLKNKVSALLKPGAAERTDRQAFPLVSLEFIQVIFRSYEEAYEARQNFVGVTELMIASINMSSVLQEFLYDMGVEKNKLTNAAEWARIRERLYRRFLKLRAASHTRPKKGMDRAMTALATPYLNQFSHDLTQLAQNGYLETCVARDKEIDEIFNVVDAGRNGVLLVGEYGAGKRTIVEGIAERMIEEEVPKRMHDKRLVRLSISELLAGTSAAGAVERLNNIMYEVARARNIVLFVPNIHELAGVSAGEAGSLDVSGTLAENLRNGDFLTIATTTDENYAKHIVGTPVGDVLTAVKVKEMDENQAIKVLESKAASLEYKNKIYYTYAALEKAVQLSARLLHDVLLPGSALEILAEAGTTVRNSKGANAFVTGDDVSKVITTKTGVPVAAVSSDESTKLMRLEEEMHKRVVGQDEAVNLIAAALRRARVELRSTKRPIANFLFLGPTGVGKTELAKTIAAVYFGGEERMLRLDMSEYQDKSAVYRLIGAPGEKGTGILTEAVRHSPYALLLLDEIEKADKDVINLFLQVMDDGRLTDSAGRVVDFTNIILIATSNAATDYVQKQLTAGLSSEAVKERLLHGELSQYFHPEFLNRFDGIVLFKALSREDIKAIAEMMLKGVAKNLEQRGIELAYDSGALEYLADVGFDPEFGARPMRRALQDKVENKLADMLLSGKLKRRDRVLIEAGGEIRVVTS